ncbi:MAG TPA: acyltransferase [Burkholderiaceae bacterium]|nr:acyltransferase [Burkholderiaceae bacterium]
MPSPPAASPRVHHADGLRAVAALWVFLFHISQATYLDRLRAQLPGALNAMLFDHGVLGIAIFFVLSGFVVALAAGPGAASPPSFGAFLMRRLVRLTPPYYASIAATLALMAAWAIWSSGPVRWPSQASIVAHLLYLQDAFGFPEINGVYWTLVVELQFYALYALLTLLAQRVAPASKQHGARIAMFAVSAGVSMFVATGDLPAPAWFGNMAQSWCAFAAGVLGGWAWTQGGAAVWASRGVIAAFALLALSGPPHATGYFIVSALTAVVLSEARLLGPLPGWLASTPLRRLGAVSYSFYLLHAPLMFLGFGIVHHLLPPSAAADLVGLAASLAICLVASAAMQRWVEAPSQRWSRRIGPHGALRRPVLAER